MPHILQTTSLSAAVVCIVCVYQRIFSPAARAHDQQPPHPVTASPKFNNPDLDSSGIWVAPSTNDTGTEVHADPPVRDDATPCDDLHHHAPAIQLSDPPTSAAVIVDGLLEPQLDIFDRNAGVSAGQSVSDANGTAAFQDPTSPPAADASIVEPVKCMSDMELDVPRREFSIYSPWNENLDQDSGDYVSKCKVSLHNSKHYSCTSNEPHFSLIPR
jgi:hypothetical protein